MKRRTILAILIALAALGACKKGDAQREPSAGGSASSKTSAGASAEAATGTPEEPRPPSVVKLTRRAILVGARRVEDSKTEMQMKLTMAGKVNEMQVSESTTREEEVLEVAGDAVTKVKVTFTEDARTTTEGGTPAKARPSAISGKTYVVAAKDGKITVSNDQDRPASKAEASLVEKQLKALGKPDPMLAAIPDRALEEGVEVPELSDAFARSMKEHDAKANIEGAKVVFVKQDGDNALFRVTVAVQSGEGPFRMTVPLSGTIALRMTDAWPARMDLDGPIHFELSEKSKKAGVEGGGTLKLSSRYTYK